MVLMVVAQTWLYAIGGIGNFSPNVDPAQGQYCRTFERLEIHGMDPKWEILEIVQCDGMWLFQKAPAAIQVAPNTLMIFGGHYGETPADPYAFKLTVLKDEGYLAQEK